MDTTVEQVEELYKLGYRIQGIAKILGTTPKVVKNRFYKLYGVRCPPVLPVPQSQIEKMANKLHRGWTLKEIREVFPYPKRDIGLILWRHYRFEANSIHNKIIEMFNKGFSLRLIVEKTGVSIHHIKNILAREGLIEEIKKKNERGENECLNIKIDPYFLRRGKITYRTTQYYF